MAVVNQILAHIGDETGTALAGIQYDDVTMLVQTIGVRNRLGRTIQVQVQHVPTSATREHTVAPGVDAFLDVTVLGVLAVLTLGTDGETFAKPDGLRFRSRTR